MVSQPRDIVVVTGSSGLIGAPLMRRLAQHFSPVGFDIVEPNHLPDNATFHRVDLTSDESVAQAVSAVRERHGSRVASVIHLAAYYNFSGEPSEKYDTITVQGTHRLLRELKQFEHVGQFVFSSTMLVHAPCKIGQTINENSPLEPKWDYPRSKVRTEQLIRQERGDIPAVMLRIAGVYDDDCNSIPLSHQMQRIFERRVTGRVFPGDTRAGQSMIHKDDLIDVMLRVVERRNDLPPETALLIGEPITLSYEELQRRFAELIHRETWHTSQIPKAVARTGAWVQEQMPGGEEPFIKSWMIDLADDHYALDISRAKHLLDWQPQHDLRSTLPSMVQALKRDPLGWYKAHKIDPPRWLQRDVARHKAKAG